jgi:predicted RNA binding protein YcfA (HicA-like mRNA interferase family)
MKLPRDVSGADLVKALKKLGYAVTRQKSSHVRMTTQQNGQHHVTIPDHDPIRVGTFADILKDLAAHHGLQRDELLDRLFG